MNQDKPSRVSTACMRCRYSTDPDLRVCPECGLALEPNPNRFTIVRWHFRRNAKWYLTGFVLLALTASWIILTTPKYAPMRYLVEFAPLDSAAMFEGNPIEDEISARLRAGAKIEGASRQRLDDRVLARALEEGFFLSRTPAGTHYVFLETHLSRWISGRPLAKIVVTDGAGNVLFQQQLRSGDGFESPTDLPPTLVNYAGNTVIVSLLRRSESGLWEPCATTRYSLDSRKPPGS